MAKSDVPPKSVVSLPSSLNVELRKGDILETRYGGGGGFGDPRERDPTALVRDIAEGKALGDTTTLADPNVVARLKDEYETIES